MGGWFVKWTNYKQMNSASQTIPLTPAIQIVRPRWITCSVPIKNPMNLIRWIFGTTLGNWITYWNTCHRRIIMPCSICATASARPTNARPFSMDSTMAPKWWKNWWTAMHTPSWKCSLPITTNATTPTPMRGKPLLMVCTRGCMVYQDRGCRLHPLPRAWESWIHGSGWRLVLWSNQKFRRFIIQKRLSVSSKRCFCMAVVIFCFAYFAARLW